MDENMDNNLKFSTQNPATRSYQSYGQEAQPGMSSPAPHSFEQAKLEYDEKQVKLSLLKDDYESNRTVILNAIKDAIKSQEFEEARDFVRKYHPVAQNDEAFKLLANTLSERLGKQNKIETFVLELELTDEDDLDKRIDLCQKILNIDPKNEEYQAELKRCLKKRGIPDTQAQKTPTNARQAFGIFALGILCFINFTLLIIGWLTSPASILCPIIAATVAYSCLRPQRTNKLSATEVFTSVVGNALFSIFMFIIFCLIIAI